MFTSTDNVIDAIHAAKKTAIATFVRNDAIAESLTNWVDVEATIAKDIVKTTTSTATTINAELTKVWQEAAKIDVTKQMQSWFGDLAKATKSK